jgi:hypothetical protein
MNLIFFSRLGRPRVNGAVAVIGAESREGGREDELAVGSIAVDTDRFAGSEEPASDSPFMAREEAAAGSPVTAADLMEAVGGAAASLTGKSQASATIDERSKRKSAGDGRKRRAATNEAPILYRQSCCVLIQINATTFYCHDVLLYGRHSGQLHVASSSC